MMVGFIKSMVMAGSGVKNIRKTVSWPDQIWEIYEKTTGLQRPEFARKKRLIR
jgi:hypothetical protein